MNLTYLDQNDVAQVGELFALNQVVHAADSPDNPPPLWEQFLAETQHTGPEARHYWLTARTGDKLVGAALLRLPQIDNRQLAEVYIRVDPAHRRRGVGRALMERLNQRIDEEGRQTVISPVIRQIPGGPPRAGGGGPFLEQLGFSPGLDLIQRRLDLTAIDESAEQQLFEACQPHAAEYEILSWTGLTPDRLADGVAHLINRLNTDAPAGELSLEQTTLDADRLHASERDAFAKSAHLVTAAAQHRGTGEVAAVSGLEVRSLGDHGSVLLTIVDPSHRGRRLGTLVKIAVHRLARQVFPTLQYVHTGNADTNTHMAAINERFGFRAFQAATIYQAHR